MGYVEDAEPLIEYHDLNGPLQDQFYHALGHFLTKYTEAEEDIVHALRGFFSRTCKGSIDTSSVIHILTAGAPVGALMDAAAVVAEEVIGYDQQALTLLKTCRSRFDKIKALRNLVAHQPAGFSPFTPTPFAIVKQTSERRIQDFRTIFIGVDAVEAAAHDVPLAGYLYRLALARTQAEDPEPTWRYKSELLEHRHHQPR